MSLVFYVVILFYVAINKFYATGIRWRIPKSYRKGAPQYLSWSTWFAWKLFGKYCSRIIQGRRDRIKRRISCILPQNERRLLQVLFLVIKKYRSNPSLMFSRKAALKMLEKTSWMEYIFKAVNYTKYVLLFFWNVFENVQNSYFNKLFQTTASRIFKINNKRTTSINPF